VIFFIHQRTSINSDPYMITKLNVNRIFFENDNIKKFDIISQIGMVLREFKFNLKLKINLLNTSFSNIIFANLKNKFYGITVWYSWFTKCW